MKTCTKCGEEKPATLDYFYAKKAGKNGLASWCKSCNNQQSKDWAGANPERQKERSRRWVAANPERQKERSRRWYRANPGRHAENIRNWREANPERQAEYARRWREANPERQAEYHREYERRRREEQPHVKLSNSISNGMLYSLKAGKAGKAGKHWESLVGYTLADLMAHLEQQFAKGMTWDNYGEWHVDHIRPISDFNFTSPDDPDFKVCWSLWNLQPLWAFDNQSKSDKCETPPLPLLHGETA